MSDTMPDAGIAIATAALVTSIFGTALPPLSEVRARLDHDGEQQTALRSAAAQAGALVAVLALATRSRSVALVGSAAIAAHGLAYGLAVPLPRL